MDELNLDDFLCRVRLKKESTGADIYMMPKKLNPSEIVAIKISNTIEDDGREYEIVNLSFDYSCKTLNVTIRD